MQIKRPPIAFGLTLALGLTVTLWGWSSAHRFQNKEIQTLTEQKLSSVQNLFKQAISERVLSFERMAKRIEENPEMPKMAWISDSSSYQKHLRGLIEMGVMSSDGSISWDHSYSDPTNLKIVKWAADLKLSGGLKYDGNITGEFRETQIISLQNSNFFITVTPILKNEKVSKYLIALSDYRGIFSSLDLGDKYFIRLMSHERNLFSNSADDTHSQWLAKGRLELGGLSLEVQVSPKAAAVAELLGALPSAILWTGLVLSFLLGLIAFLYATARSQSRDLSDATYWQNAILGSANYSVIATDPAGVIQVFNAASEKLLGYSASELIKKSTSAIFHKPEEVVARAAVLTDELGMAIQPGFDTFVAKARLKNIPDENEWTYIRKDGTTFPVRLSITALKNNLDEITGYLGIGYDITVEKEKQLQLEQSFKEVTKYKLNLEEQRDLLIVASEKALDSSKTKSEFLANMSHEIRTPLNGVIGLTDILSKTQLSDKQRGLVATIKSSGQLLMGIINDILDFSKIEAGKLEIELMDISLRSVVESHAQMLSAKAEEKQLSILTSIDPAIPNVLRGDAGRIGQILANLVGNAIKFTAKGQVVVRAKCIDHKSEKAKVRFSIEDTGVGLTPEQIAKLFQPFQQADGSTSRKFGGTGLGLSICKKLVELMGGEIGVDSQYGQGSCFWFTIEFEVVNSDEFQLPWTDKSFKDLRFLIVESNLAKRQVLHDYVLSWGMTNGGTADKRDALRILRQESSDLRPYDFVYVGSCGHESENLELSDAILKDPNLLRTKIISCHPDASKFELEGTERMVFYREPFRQSELFDCIMRLVGHADMHASKEETIKTEMRDGLILLVEDNSVNQMVAMSQLESLGYSCHAVANGIEAIEALTRSEYAVVLMDCQMPEMDGFEATRRIRQLPGPRSSVPIIALTANAMGGDREKCMVAGMDDYLTKPIDLGRLGEVLNQHFTQKRPVKLADSR